MDTKKRSFLAVRLTLCYMALLQGSLFCYASLSWKSSHAAYSFSSIFLLKSSLSVIALLFYLHFVNKWKKAALVFFIVLQSINIFITSIQFFGCLLILTGFRNECEVCVLNQEKEDFYTESALLWGILTFSVITTSHLNVQFCKYRYFSESANEEKKTMENDCIV